MVEGVPVVMLRDPSGKTQVCVGAQLGGLVMQLVVGDRQWLHRNAYVSLTHRYQGKVFAPGLVRTYGERGDVGLGDQCLFTVAADTLTLPDGTKVPLNDHGEAWPLQPPAVSVTRIADVLRTVWTMREGALPFVFRRDIRIENGTVACQFELTNAGTGPLPLFWSSHDMLELNADTRFELPLGTEMVVHQARRVEFQGEVHRWPRFILRDGRPLDLSHPAQARAMLGRDFAAKIFTRSVEGPLKVWDKSVSMTLDAPGTRAALWINWGGDSPPGERYQVTCPERCIGGTSDRVSEGVAAGDTSWLAPGAKTEWTLRYAPG
jgi:hypothetical protein